MALTQLHYRFYINELTESTHRPMSAQDWPVMVPPGRAFLCRAGLQETAGAAESNTVMQWQRRLLRAGAVVSDWTDITTTSTVVKAVASAAWTNGANCTQRLTGFTGTFESSAAGCTSDGSAGGNANDIVANGCSETELSFQIINADTNIGDVVELRVTRGGTTLMDVYAATPSVRVGVNVLAVASQDTTSHVTQTAGAGRVTDNIVTLLATGMSAADLTDSTLTITMDVWGTTVQGSTDPADYTIHLYGPDVWSGGTTGKAGTEYAGMTIPPVFGFQEDLAVDIKRILATLQPNRAVTFGADATIVPQTQIQRAG